MVRFVIIIFFSGWLAGCLPDPLPVNDIPQLDPKIVVSTQIIPDQGLIVLLTKSFGALDANGDSDPEALLDQIAINDATIVIKGQFATDTLIFLGVGVYGGVTIPFVDDEWYDLYIESPTMGNARSSAQVKESVSFNTLSADINTDGFDARPRIHYSLEDLRGKNYYMMSVQHVSIAESPSAEDFLNPNVFTSLLEDREESDGQLLGDSFSAFFRRDFVAGDTLLVQLTHIGGDYYHFLETRKNSRFSFADFLGEPVNYPTNIEGGLGWFTLHTPDVRVIIVE